MALGSTKIIREFKYESKDLGGPAGDDSYVRVQIRQHTGFFGLVDREDILVKHDHESGYDVVKTTGDAGEQLPMSDRFVRTKQQMWLYAKQENLVDDVDERWQNQWYHKYGYQGAGAEISDLDIRSINESTNPEEEWREFLKYGKGIKESKLDQHSLEAAGGLMPNIGEEDLSNWAKGKELGAEGTDFDPSYGRKDAPEDPTQWTPEEDIGSVEDDPRYEEIARREELDPDDPERISASASGYLRSSLLPEMRTTEASARDVYGEEVQDFLVESTAAESTLTNTLQDLLTEYGTSRASALGGTEDKLQSLLDEYLEKSPDIREKLTEGVGTELGEERALEASTGIGRKESTLQDLIKETSPDMLGKIEDYRQATGEEWKDVGSRLSDLYKGYSGDVQSEQSQFDVQETALSSMLTNKWDELMGSMGGGYSGGQVQDLLASDYFSDLGDYFTDIPSGDYASWY